MGKATKTVKRRRYSSEEVATALAYIPTAPSITAAAQDLNLPITTLHSWQSGRLQGLPDSAQCEEAKKNLADRFENLVNLVLDVAPNKIDAASFAQLLTGAGIATDKMRLLRDQSTANTTTTHITEEQAKQETAQLLSEAIAIYASMTDEQRATLLREQSAPIDVIEGCDRSNAEHADVEQATE
jgi:iron uptake system EfeUOB component EfeO/EfeM